MEQQLARIYDLIMSIKGWALPSKYVKDGFIFHYKSSLITFSKGKVCLDLGKDLIHFTSLGKVLGIYYYSLKGRYEMAQLVPKKSLQKGIDLISVVNRIEENLILTITSYRDKLNEVRG